MEENKNPEEDIKTTPSGVVNDPADDKAPKKEAASSAGGESDTAAPEGDKSDAPEQKNSTKGSGGGRRRRLPRAISIPLKVLMWIVIAVLLIPVALYIPPVQTFVK
ncbi:MAG: hypothetical protein K2K29_00350, partial [Muribaculaceae bacterium]|nr:hypothetical protein [Muribaculaceae bacterium]